MPRANEHPALQPSPAAFDEPPAPVAAFDDRPLFASSAPADEPVSRGGLKIWLAAAAALVLGIAIGFASGYRAGQGAAEAAAFQGQGGAPSEPASAAAPGQTFSESPVGDPVRIEEPPIVPAPEPPAPAPAPADRRETRPAASVRQNPPAPRSPENAPATVPAPTGPGSIQVLSRPAGAQVTLDGRLLGKTPMVIPEVAAGSHTIRLELATFNPWTTTVDVKAGDAVRVAASLEQ